MTGVNAATRRFKAGPSPARAWRSSAWRSLPSMGGDRPEKKPEKRIRRECFLRLRPHDPVILEPEEQLVDPVDDLRRQVLDPSRGSRLLSRRRIGSQPPQPRGRG